MFRVDAHITARGTKDFTEWFCTYSTLDEARAAAKERFDTLHDILCDGQSIRIMITKVHQVLNGNHLENEYEEVAHLNADFI